MTIKTRVYAEAQRERDMQEIIENFPKGFKKVASKEESNYEVRFFERNRPKYQGGIGVELIVALYNKRFLTVIWRGVVRGSGKCGDDSYHWYRRCNKIKKEDHGVLVTLSSTLLRDTYKVDIDNKVVLEESVNLEDLKKEEEVKKLLEEAESQEDVMFKAWKKSEAYATKLEFSEAKKPKVYDETVLKDGRIVNLIGLYRPGYDPAMKELIIMVNGEKYRRIVLERFYNPYSTPKNSCTFFEEESIEIIEDEILIRGKITQQNFSRLGLGSYRSIAEIEARV